MDNLKRTGKMGNLVGLGESDAENEEASEGEQAKNLGDPAIHMKYPSLNLGAVLIRNDLFTYDTDCMQWEQPLSSQTVVIAITLGGRSPNTEFCIEVWVLLFWRQRVVGRWSNVAQTSFCLFDQLAQFVLVKRIGCRKLDCGLAFADRCGL